MRIERLVIEAGDNTFTLDLHPRLTVVAGMGRMERESLVGELIGALGGSRPGVHVELEEQSGRHLAVFRPPAGRTRIIDIDRATDVSASFEAADGAHNVLDHLGLTSRAARQVMRFGAADLAAGTNASQSVQALATVDQSRLWAIAETLSQVEGELASRAEAIGSAPEDASVIDEVETRHLAVEHAVESFEHTRKRTFWIGGIAGLATIPGVLAAGGGGLLFAAIAMVAVAASLVARANVGRATRAEEKALEEAGATSYLGFQMQRVNGLLSNDSHRKALVDVAAARREALTAWQALAGELPVDWALDHREEIEAAARLRHDVDTLGSLSAHTIDVTEAATGSLAHVLVTRLAEARSVAGEGVPLLLDDPFQQLDPNVKPLLLELLGRSAGTPQIVFLTEDEDVASWARLESLTGDLSLIEPSPEHDRRPAPATAPA